MLLKKLKNLLSTKNTPESQEEPSQNLTPKVRYKVMKSIEKFNFKHKTRDLAFHAGAPFYNEGDEFVDLLENEVGEDISSKIGAIEKIRDYLNKCTEEEFFHALEILLKLKLETLKRFSPYFPVLNQKIIDFKDNLNDIFKTENLNHQILKMEDSKLPYKVMPITSQYLHQETVKKALSLMHDANFLGPLNEFEKALDEYKNGSYKDSIRDASNAFESTLKTILDLKKVAYDEKKDKVQVLVGKVQNECNILNNTTKPAFDSFWSVLKNSTLPIRNQSGVGHGQGKTIKTIEKSDAQFILNLVGTFIVFLIQRFNETEV